MLNAVDVAGVACGLWVGGMVEEKETIAPWGQNLSDLMRRANTPRSGMLPRWGLNAPTPKGCNK